MKSHTHGITRRGILGAAAVAVSLSLGLAGCSSSSSIGGSGDSSAPAASGSSAAGGSKSLVVGSANFPENATLAYIYGGALEDKGYDITYKVNFGARDAYLAALKSGEINLVPEYAGSLLSYLDKTANSKSGSEVKTAIDGKIGSVNAVAYDLAEAADSDSLNVTKSFADKNSLTSIADLKKLSSFTVAANPEFATRSDGIKGLKSVYGLDNIKFKAINDGGGNATLKALLGNQVQVADIYSTTPSIIENKLVTLQDPKNLFASQQVVPIVSKAKGSDDVATVLNSVSKVLTTDDLLKLNQQVSGSSKTDPQTAAKAWLKEKGL
jgi:osmoprotectant transport system substrate-binding protein